MVLKLVTPDFANYGMEISSLYIENISLPPEVEKTMDTRTSMGVIGDMNTFTKYQAAHAIREAASVPGGEAGTGVGIGAGLAMGRMMADAMASSVAPTASSATSSPAAAGTIRCTACGVDIPAGSAFCSRCGTRVVTSRFCPSCGEAVEAGDAFCGKCGKRL